MIFLDQWRALTVCLCLCMCCVLACVGKRYHSHAAHTYCPPLQGQYLQFILSCKLSLSQCLTISPSPPFLSLSLSPPLSPPLVTFAVRFNGRAWSKPIMACFERAGHPVEAIHYRQLVPIHLSLHMCILPSISLSLVPVLHAVIHSPHSCCIQQECE